MIKTVRLVAFPLLAFFVLAIESCASRLAVQLPAADEMLVPQIQADGTKFFLFQREYRRPVGDRTDLLLGRDVEARQRAGYGSDNPELLDNEIHRRLTEVLLVTGYCREGYFELYRDSTRTSFSLRGECREVATDADHSRFRDPIAL